MFFVVCLLGEAGEGVAQEDFQYKLKGFIDSTVDKRWNTSLTQSTIVNTHIVWGQGAGLHKPG